MLLRNISFRWIFNELLKYHRKNYLVVDWSTLLDNLWVYFAQICHAFRCCLYGQIAFDSWSMVPSFHFTWNASCLPSRLISRSYSCVSLGCFRRIFTSTWLFSFIAWLIFNMDVWHAIRIYNLRCCSFFATSWIVQWRNLHENDENIPFITSLQTRTCWLWSY